MFLTIIFWIIEILFILYIFFLIVAFFIGSPFVPTPNKAVKEMIELAKIKNGDKVVDIGSGDGRILISAAKKGALAFGWEINPLFVFFSIFKAIRNKTLNRIRVYWGDYRKADLRRYNIVFLYTINYRIKEIEKKLLKELEPGTKIISYKFKLSTLKEKIKTDSGIYFYQI